VWTRLLTLHLVVVVVPRRASHINCRIRIRSLSRHVAWIGSRCVISAAAQDQALHHALLSLSHLLEPPHTSAAAAAAISSYTRILLWVGVIKIQLPACLNGWGSHTAPVPDPHTEALLPYPPYSARLGP
jgi:hypothetical protein